MIRYLHAEASPFQALLDGRKTHVTCPEAAQPYAVGQLLDVAELLPRWGPEGTPRVATGRSVRLEVTHVEQLPGSWAPGIVVMSVRKRGGVRNFRPVDATETEGPRKPLET